MSLKIYLNTLNKKGIFILLSLFFLLQACSKIGPKWACLETHGACKNYTSKLLVLTPENSFRELELVFSLTESGMRTYLNVYTFTFSQEDCFSGKTKILISGNGWSQEFLADRFEGGQRVLLPEEAQTLILSNLLNKNCFTIASGRFSSKITLNGFSNVWKKFLRS